MKGKFDNALTRRWFIGGLCRIPLSDFKFRGKCRFDVRPIECFGHKGKAISTTFRI